MRTIRDCNVCVVGGAGFLGSHLVDHLIEDRGCEVLVLDNLCAGRREFINSKAHFLHVDITDSEDHLRRIFAKGKIRFVLNFAAYPYVPDSFTRPLHVFNVNAVGAIKVINAAQEAGVEAVLQVSSAELYGGVTEESKKDGWDGRIGEWANVEPHSTYGLAKAAVDSYVQCSWRERKTPVIALRQFNCVGERDETHPYVIPEIISQLAKRKYPPWEDGRCHLVPLIPEVRLGNNSFRDFMYAKDAVKIAVELLERGEFGSVYNLGSESGVKIYDLAKRIGQLMGFEQIEVVVDKNRIRPYEIWHLQSDNSKIRDILGEDSCINSLVPFDEVLTRTIGYMQSTNWRLGW